MHTGNINLTGKDLLCGTVYPCAYREHCSDDSDDDWITGLSLCIQGTWQYICENKVVRRFIPVHTGNISALLLDYLYASGLSLYIQGTY